MRGTMKRIMAAGALAAIALASAIGQGAKPVLILLREKSENFGFVIKNEVLPMIALMKEAGYDVKVATVSGSSFDFGGLKLQVDLRLADARVEDYAGLLVPCMMAASFPVSPDEVGVVRAAVEKGLPLAAQHAFELLSPAGALSGKRYVMYGPGVVRDGLLVTSYNSPNMALSNRKPADTETLIASFVEVLREGE